jgi:hypothetical protein
MDVETISVPRHVVNEKLREYRRGLHRKADDEWKRVTTAYEAAESGKPLVVLSAAIANCPRDAQHRPKLAIARADRTKVWYHRSRDSRNETFTTTEQWRSRGRPVHDLVITVPIVEGVTPAYPPTQFPQQSWRDGTITGTALVPMVPPAAKGNRDLSKYLVLWEVPEWTVAPPVDPYLLRKVADDLYIVEAEWDLTDIERAVMASRARA